MLPLSVDHYNTFESTAKATMADTKVSLLDLPAELRVRIFTFVLAAPENEPHIRGLLYRKRKNIIRSKGWQQLAKWPTVAACRMLPHISIPAICRVNRLFRREALEIYSVTHRFYLREAIDYGWLFTVDPVVVSQIRQLRLQHTIACDINLSRQSPYFSCTVYPCIDHCTESTISKELTFKLNDALNSTLAGERPPSFNVLYLVQLWELWILLCEGMYRSEEGAVHRATEIHHTMRRKMALAERVRAYTTHRQL